MRIKRSVFAIIVLVVVVVIFMFATDRVTLAQSGSPDPAILAKLDEVLSNQRLIMAELASLKEEIQIVKIRVTQLQ